MSVIQKEQYLKQPNKKSVSKKEFEKAWIELMDEVRIMDQKLSTKADEVVLTMALSHQQEIEELQTEILSLRDEMKKMKEGEKREKPIQKAKMQRSRPKNWFKKLQLSRN